MEVVDYKEGIVRREEIPLRAGICECPACACKQVLRWVVLWARVRGRREQSHSHSGDPVSWWGLYCFAWEYGGAWSPELAHRQGAHQSNHRNAAVHWDCVARFWGGYEGQILWESARNFPWVQWSQCQLAPRWTRWVLGLFCLWEKLLHHLPVLILTHKAFVVSLSCWVVALVSTWHNQGWPITGCWAGTALTARATGSFVRNTPGLRVLLLKEWQFLH